MSFTKALLVDTFRHSPEIRREMEKQKLSLCNRAWAYHISITFCRIIFPLLGISYWQKAFANRTSNETFNQDFIDAYEPVIKGVIITLIPLGLIIDVVSYWRRGFAESIFYFELLSIFVQGFVPIDRGDAGTLLLLMVMNSNAVFTVVSSARVCVISIVLV